MPSPIPPSFTALASTRAEIRTALADGSVSSAEARNILQKAMPTGAIDAVAAREVATLYRMESVFENASSRTMLRDALLGYVSPRQLGVSMSKMSPDYWQFANSSRSEFDRLKTLFPNVVPDIGGAMPAPGPGFLTTPFKPEQFLAERPELVQRLAGIVDHVRALGLPDEDGELRVSMDVLSKDGVVYGFAVSSFSDYPPVTSHWGRSLILSRDMDLLGEIQ